MTRACNTYLCTFVKIKGKRLFVQLRNEVKRVRDCSGEPAGTRTRSGKPDPLG